jgi:adenine-specific DNA-methyltransferase
LTEDEVFGIVALFNSALIDRYFRTVSGNTQVNATDVRAMSFPDLKLLGRIGKQVRRDPANAEAVVCRELGVESPPQESLVGA